MEARGKKVGDGTEAGQYARYRSGRTAEVREVFSEKGRKNARAGKERGR